MQMIFLGKMWQKTTEYCQKLPKMAKKACIFLFSISRFTRITRIKLLAVNYSHQNYSHRAIMRVMLHPIRIYFSKPVFRISKNWKNRYSVFSGLEFCSHFQPFTELCSHLGYFCSNSQQLQPFAAFLQFFHSILQSSTIFQRFYLCFTNFCCTEHNH